MAQITKQQPVRMTGQEWYDRFKLEFMKDDTVSFNGDLLAVARRAANINDKENR